LRIVLPLSKAVLATMILFYAVMFWNSWFPRVPVPRPLGPLPGHRLPAQPDRRVHWRLGLVTPSETALQIGSNIQAVTIVLTVLPVMLVYPFIQRYFVSGVMLGAVKG